MRPIRLSSRLFVPLLAVSLLVGGCSSLSNTEKGAAVGAGAGGAAGAAVGKAVGETAKGAVLGAIVGGTAGAIIGQRMDKKAKELDENLENAEVQRVGEGIVVTFDSGLLFDFDSAALREDARTDLREFAGSMNEYPETNILVVGHTDSIGSDTYNQRLSERRAQSAGEYLVDQGLVRDRLTLTGKGETEAVASNETESGRQLNRRVEVAIYASEEYREKVQKSASGQ
jgi:outer membrane protein OmpA-like peptidoglycan-associated protein